jgi:hypothetical protein
VVKAQPIGMGAGVARVFFVGLVGLGCGVATACVTFSPEVKQTFEPKTAKEHSNFEPRSPPYRPIYVGPLARDGGDEGGDAGADVAVPVPVPVPVPGLAPGLAPLPAEGGIL